MSLASSSKELCAWSSNPTPSRKEESDRLALVPSDPFHLSIEHLSDSLRESNPPGDDTQQECETNSDGLLERKRPIIRKDNARLYSTGL